MRSSKSLLFISGLFFLLNANAQTIQFVIVDKESKSIEAATVKSLISNQYAIANEKGIVAWNLDTSEEIVEITHIGYKTKRYTLTPITQTIIIEENIRELDEANITASWVKPNDIVVHSSISAQKLQTMSLVQDIPILLQQLPSTVSSSDAGNGIGYTGIRIRGLDPSQVNVMVNGVPFNDAESQGVFWVDMPDIIASASEIQVQRGIGLSGSGQAAFGSSILINTNQFTINPYLHIEAGIGSFNTWKTSLSLGSGLLKNNFSIRGRLSKIHSDGYVDRASSDLVSGNISISKVDTRRSFRFHYFDGLEETYQAWYGLPIQYLVSNRKYNPAGTEKSNAPYENQIDHYRQTHFQFLHTENLNDRISLNNTLHYTPGTGYYEEYKANQNLMDYKLPGTDKEDIVRRKSLASHFIGTIHVLTIDNSKTEYQIGASWNNHKGRHFGQVIQTGNEILASKPIYYDWEANKFSSMFFGIVQKHLNRLSLVGDFQYRNVYYEYTKETENAVTELASHHFINPKLGFSYFINNKFQLFGFSGLAHREPNRNDYVEADTNLPKAEKLWDNELGYRYKAKNFSIEQNIYYMDYKNQLIPTGKLNDVGAYVRSNVPSSYRFGIEHVLEYQSKAISIKANLTISDTKTKNLTEYIDNWDTGVQELRNHTKKPIAFSPSIIGNINTILPIFTSRKGVLHHILTCSSDWQYIGKQYLDGTGSDFSKLPGYQVSNLGLQYQLQKNNHLFMQFNLSINNIFNTSYEANGWIYRFTSPSYNPVPDDPYSQSENNSYYSLKGIYPQAGTNILFTTKLFF